MIKYRAVRKPHQNEWTIEEFHTEDLVSVDYHYLGKIKSFKSKREAEDWIRTLINIHGETGDWFDGPF